MARSLEGKVFYRDQNNGVSALISEMTGTNLRRRHNIISAVSGGLSAERQEQTQRAVEAGLAHIPRGPIFTFANAERFAKSPWFSGTDRLFSALQEHIGKHGGCIEDATFYVPFSNGAEIGLHGLAAQTSELRYVTTDNDFINEFGISPLDLTRKER